MAETARPTSSSPPLWWRLFWWAVIALVGILAWYGIGALRGPSSGVAEAPHAQTGCSAARRAVEARLRSPASAKWGDCHSTTRDGVQTVRVSVDSQNGFGALIRSEWMATVRNNSVESVVQVR